MKKVKADFSNRAIVSLLMLSLLVTVIGTVVTVSQLSEPNSFGISGAATTGTGSTSITIQAQAGIVMNDANATFGTGYVNPGNTTATIYTHGGHNFQNNTNITGAWTNVANLGSDPNMTIENTGNVDINLTAAANHFDAEEFFCGSELGCTSTATARLSISAGTAEAGSCDTGILLNFRDLLNQTNTSSPTAPHNLTGVLLCGDFDYGNSGDLLSVSYRASVPFDAAIGGHSTIITFTAESIGQQD
ncbi:hypothetical protein COV20_03565 [Candidatus Woesearchaeota archaeon CG10_big_fil_rev_8_21_14_0_10_45_16]|nr:MAG: hypothetical protein COV20_03565 [Candidatus Woesearchaeota archaeon CG10_big_fil_rev_8_21_14_0_10_45_16]